MELEALANRSNSSVIDDHRPAAFMKSEIPIRKLLRQNSAMFLGLEKRLFQFMWNQKMPLKPKVNHEMVVAEAMDRMESKTGIALEMMKQRTQKMVTMVIQMDQERTLLAVISLWSLKCFMTWTYTYLIPVWPKARPVEKMAGRTMP